MRKKPQKTKVSSTKKKVKSTQNWVACHWIDGSIVRTGTEKEMRDFCRKNSFNPEHPIYYAYPINGINIVEVKHDHGTLVKAALAVLQSNRAFIKLLKEIE